MAMVNTLKSYDENSPGINAGDEIHPPWIAPWDDIQSDSTTPICENKRGDCAGREKYCHK